MDERFIQAIAAALAVHGALAYALVKLPAFNRKHDPTVIQMALKQRPLQPQKVELEPPPPPKKIEPPPPPLKKPKKPPPPPEEAKAPPPNETPKEPPKEPPKPVFGLSASSTAENGVGIAMPVGNTTVGDPNAARPKGPIVPLGPPPPHAAPAPVFRAASPLYIKDYPIEDVDACTPPQRLYPEDLREQGVQGDTLVRIDVEDTGKIHSARALKGPAKALNDIATAWIRAHCTFKPAIGSDGKPVAASITYTVKWEISN